MLSFSCIALIAATVPMAPSVTDAPRDAVAPIWRELLPRVQLRFGPQWVDNSGGNMSMHWLLSVAVTTALPATGAARSRLVQSRSPQAPVAITPIDDDAEDEAAIAEIPAHVQPRTSMPHRPTDAAITTIGPRLVDIIRAAWRALRLDQLPSDRGARARLSGLVPRFSITADADTGQNLTTEQSLADQLDDYRSRNEQRVGGRVELSFDFARLAFHPDEPAMARDDVRFAAARASVLAQVTSAWSNWQRAMRALAATPIDSRAEIALERDTAAATLDALTDGWFGAQLGGS